MKKHVFIDLGKRKRITLENFRTDTLGFTLGMLLALLLGWLVYPDFGLSKIEIEATVSSKIGGYTQYTYYYGDSSCLSEQFSKKKIIPEEKIEDKVKKDIKLKDHHDYRWNSIVQKEELYLILYNTLLLVLLLVFFMFRENNEYLPMLSGFLLASTIIDIIILTLYWA